MRFRQSSILLVMISMNLRDRELITTLKKKQKKLKQNIGYKQTWRNDVFKESLSSPAISRFPSTVVHPSYLLISVA